MFCVASIQIVYQALQLKVLAKQGTVAQRDDWPGIEAAYDGNSKLIFEEYSGYGKLRESAVRSKHLQSLGSKKKNQKPTGEENRTG